MSTVNPELIALTAGTVKAWEIGQQIDPTGPTGVGTIREQDTHAIPMNVAANLPRGEGFIIRKRRNVRVHFAPVQEEEIKKRANQSDG